MPESPDSVVTSARLLAEAVAGQHDAWLPRFRRLLDRAREAGMVLRFRETATAPDGYRITLEFGNPGRADQGHVVIDVPPGVASTLYALHETAATDARAHVTYARTLPPPSRP